MDPWDGPVLVGDDLEKAGGWRLGARLARDRPGPPLVFQLLIYPATDLHVRFLSNEENADAPLLTKRDLAWFTGQYAPREEVELNSLASPLLAPDLAALLPAFIVTAEYDPLRDEGEAYGRHL